MQKQPKVPAAKPCLRAAVWIILVTGAAGYPGAHAQSGQEPATPPAAETFSYRFRGSAKRDSLLALLPPGSAGRVPVALPAGRHYSPRLQGRVLTGGGRLSLYRAAVPGTAGNPKPLSPADGTAWAKIRREADPLPLEEYLRILKKKP